MEEGVKHLTDLTAAYDATWDELGTAETDKQKEAIATRQGELQEKIDALGAWDGRPWSEIAHREVDAWQADLLHHAPGGGEPLAALAARVWAFVAGSAGHPGAPRLLVSHGGWLNALRHVPPGCVSLAATAWPAPPRHGALVRWPAPPAVLVREAVPPAALVREPAPASR